MGLSDYIKGPEHKANAALLEAELQAHRQQSQADILALQAKYDDLETKARELGLLDLLAVQEQIQAEEARLASVQAQVATTQSDLETARGQLQVVKQQILGAEDTVQLESFALYEPKYQFTNSVDYKNRLDEIREDQKRTARGLSAEVDAWDSHAVELTKAQWKKLRKDALKLALRSFNSESEYCVDNVKFSSSHEQVGFQRIRTRGSRKT